MFKNSSLIRFFSILSNYFVVAIYTSVLGSVTAGKNVTIRLQNDAAEVRAA